LVYSLGKWLVRREWKRVLGWLLATLFVSLVLAVIAVTVDQYRQEDPLPYEWRGWYWIWFFGVYVTGLLLVPVALFHWALQFTTNRRRPRSTPRAT
jgi:hypothetical protein